MPSSYSTNQQSNWIFFVHVFDKTLVRKIEKNTIKYFLPKNIDWHEGQSLRYANHCTVYLPYVTFILGRNILKFQIKDIYLFKLRQVVWRQRVSQWARTFLYIFLFLRGAIFTSKIRTIGENENKHRAFLLSVFIRKIIFHVFVDVMNFQDSIKIFF